MSTIKTLVQMVQTTGQTVQFVDVSIDDDDMGFGFRVNGDLPDDPLEDDEVVVLTTAEGQWRCRGNTETLDDATFEPNGD